MNLSEAYERRKVRVISAYYFLFLLLKVYFHFELTCDKEDFHGNLCSPENNQINLLPYALLVSFTSLWRNFDPLFFYSIASFY